MVSEVFAGRKQLQKGDSKLLSDGIKLAPGTYYVILDIFYGCSVKPVNKGYLRERICFFVDKWSLFEGHLFFFNH